MSWEEYQNGKEHYIKGGNEYDNLTWYERRGFIVERDFWGNINKPNPTGSLHFVYDSGSNYSRYDSSLIDDSSSVDEGDLLSFMIGFVYLCMIGFLIFGADKPLHNEAFVSHVADSYAPIIEGQTELDNSKSVDISIIDGEQFLKKSILTDERNLELFITNILDLNNELKNEGNPVSGGIALLPKWRFELFLKQDVNRYNIAKGISKIILNMNLSEDDKRTINFSLNQLGYSLNINGELNKVNARVSLQELILNPIIRAEFVAIEVETKFLHQI